MTPLEMTVYARTAEVGCCEKPLLLLVSDWYKCDDVLWIASVQASLLRDC